MFFVNACFVFDSASDEGRSFVQGGAVVGRLATPRLSPLQRAAQRRVGGSSSFKIQNAFKVYLRSTEGVVRISGRTHDRTAGEYCTRTAIYLVPEELVPPHHLRTRTW